MTVVRIFVGLALACACIFTIEHEASACNVCIPTGGITMPEYARVLPANAGFFVIDVDDPDPVVQAWVDGVEAELEIVEGVALQKDYYGIVARVVPTPPVGAEIEVAGDPAAICFGDDPAIPVSWQAGPPDESVPDNLGDPFFDLHEVSAWDSCVATSAVLYVRGDVPLDPEGDAARRLEVEVTDGVASMIRTFVIDTREPAFEVRLGPSSGLPSPLAVDDLCMRVSIWDVAGHRSDPSPWICEPCHVVNAPTRTVEVPEEPAWSDADLADDAYCGIAAPPREPDASSTSGSDDTTDADAGTSDGDAPTPPPDPDPPGPGTTGSDADEPTTAGQDGGTAFDRGCACSSRPSAASPWLLALVLAALRRRRRRA